MKSKVDTNGKSLYPMIGSVDSSLRDQKLEEFASDALREYGAYVVEDRAVPDYRDGLKPVHRALLWSLAGLGLRPNSAYKKSARTVGDTIGKYHPHGDMSAYGAMVTIANTSPPAVDGQGNWGTPINPPASSRYTEARMSKFTSTFMLDKNYLEVVPKVPNYSGDDVIPLFLPALLPYAMFNGNIPAPAYGVRAGNPSFSFRSVAKVVTTLLKGRQLSEAQIAKMLKIQHAWGCTASMPEAEMLEMIKTGKGRVTYEPIIEEDFDKKLIQIRSFVPSGLSSATQIDKTFEKISDLNGVRKCYSKQGKKSINSGPYGALFIVECQRNIDHDTFYDILEAVQKHTSSKIAYRFGVTIRKHEKSNDFHYLGYAKFLSVWIKYRISLELRLIKNLLGKAEKELHLQEVYLFAVENMEKLLRVLPKVLVSNDPDSALAKAMRMPVEDATIILNRQVRKLARLEAADLKAKIAELQKEIAVLRKDLKNPGERAARDTHVRVTNYLKNSDRIRSGITL